MVNHARPEHESHRQARIRWYVGLVVEVVVLFAAIVAVIALLSFAP